MPIFESHRLRILDVEVHPTHGGSLRLFVVKDTSGLETSRHVNEIIALESEFDPRDSAVIQQLQNDVNEIKVLLSDEVSRLEQLGLKIAAYGAAAKGNTLLNFVGLNSKNIDYVVDMNPHKQGKFLPGSRIPIVNLEHLKNNPPDVVLILPWNLASEIREIVASVLGSEVRLMKAIPKLEYI
jgi:hypothetical protein